MEGVAEVSVIAALYAKEHARLVSYLRRRLPTLEDAEDLAQAAFLRLWRKREIARNPSGYLWRTARNLVADFYRQAMPLAELAEWSVAYDTPLDAGVMAEWALDQLIAPQRYDMMARFVGYSQREIAEARDVTVWAVNVSLVRARARARKAGLSPSE